MSKNGRLHSDCREELIAQVNEWALPEVTKLVAAAGRAAMGNEFDRMEQGTKRRIQEAIKSPNHSFSPGWCRVWRGYFKRSGAVVDAVGETEVLPTEAIESTTARRPRAGGLVPQVTELNGAACRLLQYGTDKDGDPAFVFVAKDLIEAVGATWSGHSLDHIPAEYRGMVSVSTPSGTQQMVTLTEAGMNMYLFRSDKEAAIPWQHHLAEDVLPAIRKTGRYETRSSQRQLPPPPDPLLVQILDQNSKMLGVLMQLVSRSAQPQKSARRAKAVSEKQTRLGFSSRDALEDLIREVAPTYYDGDYNRAHRDLYQEFARRKNGVDPLLEAKAASLRESRVISGIQWLDEHGYIEEVKAIALALWCSGKPPENRTNKDTKSAK